MSDGVESKARFRWGPIFLWATIAYCFVAALAIAFGAHLGRLPGHDLNQIVPVLVHLLLNGVSLAVLAWPFRPSSLFSGLLRIGGFIFGLVFSLIGLALGVQALFDFSLPSAPALLLAVPGTTVLAILLQGYIRSRRFYPSEKVLEERPPPSSASAIIISVGLTIYLAVFFATIQFAPYWFAVLKMVLWTGAHYRVVDFGEAISFWARHVPWPIILGVLLLVVTSLTWTLLKLRYRLPLSQGQRETVQSRLRALWDYANAPDQKSRTFATAVFPLIPALGVYVLSIILPTQIEKFVQSFAPPSKFATLQSWYFFTRNEHWALFLPLIFSFFAGMALALSVHRLCVDLWPRALQGELISNLRQSFKSWAIDTRRALEKDVWRGKDSSFDPRSFLLKLRMRVSWRIYLATLALLLVAAVVVWRSINAYVIATDSGFEVAPFFSLVNHHYRYSDAARVRIDCNRYSYRVEFNDGRSAELLAHSPASFESIARIDQHLRASGTKFVILVDKRGALGVRQCASSLGQYYGHTDALAKIMHQE